MPGTSQVEFGSGPANCAVEGFIIRSGGSRTFIGIVGCANICASGQNEANQTHRVLSDDAGIMKAAQLCFALLIACPCVISARKLVEEFGFHFFASTRPVAAKHTRLNQEKTKRSLWVLFLSSISVGVELSILFLESWATIPLAGDGTLYRQSFCTNRKAHQFTLLLFVLYFANLSHYVVDLVEFALAHFTRRRPATSDMMVFWVRLSVTVHSRAVACSPQYHRQCAIGTTCMRY